MFEADLKALGDLMKVVRDLDQRASVQMTSMESRKVTLEKEITRLQADFDFHTRRNDEVKRAYQQNVAADQHKLLMDQTAVKVREEKIFERERDMQQLRAQMEAEMLRIQKLREEIESERRHQHEPIKLAKDKSTVLR